MQSGPCRTGVVFCRHHPGTDREQAPVPMQIFLLTLLCPPLPGLLDTTQLWLQVTPATDPGLKGTGGTITWHASTCWATGRAPMGLATVRGTSPSICPAEFSHFHSPRSTSELLPEQPGFLFSWFRKARRNSQRPGPWGLLSLPGVAHPVLEGATMFQRAFLGSSFTLSRHSLPLLGDPGRAPTPSHRGAPYMRNSF